MTRVAPENPLPPSLRPALQQDYELEALESNDEDVGAAVDIRGFATTAYRYVGIWARIDLVKDV